MEMTNDITIHRRPPPPQISRDPHGRGANRPEGVSGPDGKAAGDCVFGRCVGGVVFEGCISYDGSNQHPRTQHAGLILDLPRLRVASHRMEWQSRNVLRVRSNEHGHGLLPVWQARDLQREDTAALWHLWRLHSVLIRLTLAANEFTIVAKSG